LATFGFAPAPGGDCDWRYAVLQELPTGGQRTKAKPLKRSPAVR
jgi:hypothetical protein